MTIENPNKRGIGLGLLRLLPKQLSEQIKRDYSIRDLSNEFGVTLRALHFYEEEGLLSPRRKSGTRIYSNKDRMRLQLILMTKRFGFSLSEIQEIIEINEKEHVPRDQLLKMTDRFKSQLFALEERSRILSRSTEELRQGIKLLESMGGSTYQTMPHENNKRSLS